MSLPLSLLRGERPVWSDQYGHRSARENLFHMGLLLALCVAFSLLLSWLVGLHPLSSIEGCSVALLPGAIWVGLGVLLVRHARAHFSGVLLGDAHLVTRSWFTAQSIPLTAILSCRRLTTEMEVRGHSREVSTRKLELVLTDERVVTIGPVFECDELAEMLAGILAGTIVPATLPSLTADGTRAERRSQLLWVRPAKGTIVHGPLVVTPRWLAYFATPLGPTQEDHLETLLASSGPIEDIEERLVALAHQLDMGTVRLVERELYNVRIFGGTWLLVGSPPDDDDATPEGYRALTSAPTGPSNEEVIPLDPREALRVEAFLRSHG